MSLVRESGGGELPWLHGIGMHGILGINTPSPCFNIRPKQELGGAHKHHSTCPYFLTISSAGTAPKGVVAQEILKRAFYTGL